MRKVFLGAAALSMILATGCQNEELVQQTSANEYSLTLDMSAGSRTLHNEAGHCVWGDNEALYVVGDGGKVYGKLTMKSKSEGGKKAVFSGKVMGDPGKLQYMVYPVPQADGTIPMGEIDGANHNAPMTGIINRGVVSDVDYAGGSVKIPVKGTNDIAINAENKDGKVVTGGSYTFDPETGKLTFNANSGSVVTITNIPENGSVYVPVETDVQEGSTDETEKIIVDVTTGEGSNQQTQSFEAEVQEGAVTTNNVPSIEVDEESGAVNATVTTKEQLLSAIAAGGYVKLKADITAKEIITISSDVVLDGNGHTLTSSAGRAINVDGNNDKALNVTIKDLTINASGERGINIINGIGHSVNIENVTATAYNYTVNVAATTSEVSVTILDSELHGKNVVNIWGRNSAIDIINSIVHSSGSNNTETYSAIMLEQDATQGAYGSEVNVQGGSIIAEYVDGNPSHAVYNKILGTVTISETTNVKGDFVNASVIIDYGTEYFYSIENLQDAIDKVAADDKGIIRLLADIEFTEELTVPANENITIDLNGFELQGVIKNNGNLTIIDTNDSEQGKYLEDKLTIIMGTNSAVLNMSSEPVKSIRIDNTVGSSSLNLPANDRYIVYHKFTGNSNLMSWYNLNYVNQSINTIVIDGTFTFRNADMHDLIDNNNITAGNLKSTVDTYFAEFSQKVKRLELENGSTLHVDDEVAASGYQTVVAKGEVTISGNGKEQSTLYLCGGSIFLLMDESIVTVKDITLAVGNNGDETKRAYVKVGGENCTVINDNALIMSGNGYNEINIPDVVKVENK